MSRMAGTSSQVTLIATIPCRDCAIHGHRLLEDKGREHIHALGRRPAQAHVHMLYAASAWLSWPCAGCQVHAAHL